MYHQAIYDEPILNHIDASRIEEKVEDSPFIPDNMKRSSGMDVPILSELDVVRHFTRLSEMNFGVESGFYPLGSCTMKYNPKIAKKLLSLPQLSDIHPYQPDSTVQGILESLYWLEVLLSKIGGMDAVTLQPAAGALGEFTGLLITRAYFEHIGENRTEVIVPDSAHGTNPASAAMAGFNVKVVESDQNGMVDLAKLKENVSEKTAALMLTNPNTLGIFDSNVLEISTIIHQHGALLYYDGANINPIMGITTPGKMGFDIVHFNLHKSFGTPHGGGGPGSGPVGVVKKLEPFLPVPRIVYKEGKYTLDYNYELSIGKVSPFYGNVAVAYMAYIYILNNGKEGLIKNAVRSTVNSNYMKEKLKNEFDLPFSPRRFHEFVLSLEKIKNEKGIRALDFAKRIIDYGMHPPTIYFPHLVNEAFMIEPTETESKSAMDKYIETLIKIKNEDPDLIKGAPYNTSVGRVDEVEAARRTIVSWKDLDSTNKSL